MNGLYKCKMEKRNSQCVHWQPIKKTRGLFCKCESGVVRCQSPLSLLENELDLRSVLHGLVSLASVNHIYLFHEVMKIHLRLALKMFYVQR